MTLAPIPPGQYSKQAPPLTGAAKVASDAKAAKAMAYFQSAQRAWAAQSAQAVAPDQVPPPDNPPQHKTLSIPLQIQQETWWCGPATMAMIVKYKQHPFSGTVYQQQDAASHALGTTQAYGTDYGAMKPALNTQIAVSVYQDMTLPDSPSSSQIQGFEANLVYDINRSLGWRRLRTSMRFRSGGSTTRVRSRRRRIRRTSSCTG